MRYKVDACITFSYIEFLCETFDSDLKTVFITENHNVDLFETDELRETSDKSRITKLLREKELERLAELEREEKQELTTDEIVIFIRDTKNGIYKEIKMTPELKFIDTDYLDYLE